MIAHMHRRQGKELTTALMPHPPGGADMTAPARAPRLGHRSASAAHLCSWSLRSLLQGYKAHDLAFAFCTCMY